MNISKFSRLLLLSSMLLVVEVSILSADEVACDDNYNACIQKCNDAENAPETCFEACDTAYNKCLDASNNPPEVKELPEATEAPEPTEEPVAPETSE